MAAMMKLTRLDCETMLVRRGALDAIWSEPMAAMPTNKTMVQINGEKYAVRETVAQVHKKFLLQPPESKSKG